MSGKLSINNLEKKFDKLEQRELRVLSQYLIVCK